MRTVLRGAVIKVIKVGIRNDLWVIFLIKSPFAPFIGQFFRKHFCKKSFSRNFITLTETVCDRFKSLGGSGTVEPG